MRSKITIVQGDKIVSQDAEIVKTFNKYLINIPILNMPNNPSVSCQTSSSKEDTTTGIVERYKEHPSIKLKNCCLANTFSFMPVSIEEVKRSIECLNVKKTEQEKDIQMDIRIQNSVFFVFYSQKDINASISALNLPNDLKEADIILYTRKNRSYLK